MVIISLTDVLFPIYLQGQNMNMVQMEDLFEPLDSGGEYIEEPWDPRPQRVRPPSVKIAAQSVYTGHLSICPVVPTWTIAGPN